MSGRESNDQHYACKMKHEDEFLTRGSGVVKGEMA